MKNKRLDRRMKPICMINATLKKIEGAEGTRPVLRGQQCYLKTRAGAVCRINRSDVTLTQFQRKCFNVRGYIYCRPIRMIARDKDLYAEITEYIHQINDDHPLYMIFIDASTSTIIVVDDVSGSTYTGNIVENAKGEWGIIVYPKMYHFTALGSFDAWTQCMTDLLGDKRVYLSPPGRRPTIDFQ